MKCSNLHFLNASQFKKNKQKKTPPRTPESSVWCWVLSHDCMRRSVQDFSGSCFSNVASAAVSQFPSGQLLMAKCLLIWDKNVVEIIEKNEDLENQPSFNCNLILSARSKCHIGTCILGSTICPQGSGCFGTITFPRALWKHLGNLVEMENWSSCLFLLNH